MTGWTEDDRKVARDLWDRNLSASQIARNFPGRSRNSVLGMAWRNGFPKREPRSMSPEERAVRKQEWIRRSNARHRERYRSDPAYREMAKERGALYRLRNHLRVKARKRAWEAIYRMNNRDLVNAKARDRYLNRKTTQIFAPAAPYKTRIEHVPETAVTFLQLKSNHDGTSEHCKWIIGEPKGLDTIFCGAAPAKCLPYCASHALLAYQPRREELAA